MRVKESSYFSNWTMQKAAINLGITASLSRLIPFCFYSNSKFTDAASLISELNKHDLSIFSQCVT